MGLNTLKKTIESSQYKNLEIELVTMKKTSYSQFESLVTGIVALKKQLTSLVVTLQQKNLEKSDTSSSIGGGLDLTLVQVRDIQTRAIKLDFLIFLREDPSGWLCKVQQFFSFYNTLIQTRLRYRL